MKNQEQFIGLSGRNNSILQVFVFLLLIAPLTSSAQSGNGIYDAIPMGSYGSVEGYSYYNVSGNSEFNNGIYFQDNYNSTYYYSYKAQPSTDVWYSFFIEDYVDVSLSLCGSDFDTYLHLLDGSGNEVASNDDSPACGMQSAINYSQLEPGEYMVVVEGKDTGAGNFNLAMTVFKPSPSPGANMFNAIDAGTLLAGGAPFSDTRSNADPLLGNDMGQPSYDIYYKFTLNAAAEVALSHCGSGIDTYMHLLNSTGLILDSNDDNYNSPCPGSRSHIQTTLPAGTYYVVSEGAGSTAGIITTAIGIVSPASQVPAISYPGLSGLAVGVPVSMLPTNTGGDVQDMRTVFTLAGSGSIGSEDGVGTSASFGTPHGVAVDPLGNVYIADTHNYLVRKITPLGIVRPLLAVVLLVRSMELVRLQVLDTRRRWRQTVRGISMSRTLATKVFAKLLRKVW